MKKFLFILPLIVTPLIFAEVNDPLEGVNRTFFNINEKVDEVALKPIALTYSKTPDPIKNGITNFFRNLKEIDNTLNQVLQGKPKYAANDFSRFLINSTLGLGGILDPASSMGLERHDEDFGQTLAVWGVNEGPYVVLPFFGPSTMRDTPSIPVDQWLLDPMTHVELSTSQRMAVIAVDKVSLRAELLAIEETVEEISTDKYAFIREAYLDRRNFLIHDGTPPVDDDLYQQLD